MTIQLREQMNVVIVGHVDHGKSTLIGRLLADTGSLPEGKLEAVKENCKRNSKPFEYAFLLDALKDEQSQGITIDTARCFFKSAQRDYIIIDAPGHIEFLKNMITGAARAQAAMLLIDAHEGIKENSKRHGYMMSFLGIKNINVCVNKMDLIGFDENEFNKIKNDYTLFLNEINLKPLNFIPISAMKGDNVALKSKEMPWYNGLTILEAFDEFKKASAKNERAFRFPVQDIYKFTAEGDDRRIVAGRVESGTVTIGEEVVFLPSMKKSRIVSIEGFNVGSSTEVFAGQCSGFTLDTQIYIKPGEIMCKAHEKHPHVSNKLKVNIFWMGKRPLVKNKNYKLKIATSQVPVMLSEILSVLDASELSSINNKLQVDRHDVAECVFETIKPIAFDEVSQIAETGRFVLVDDYEIVGGGIILSPVFEEGTELSKHIREREFQWARGNITSSKRVDRYKHKSILLILTGASNIGKIETAKMVEEELFRSGNFVYFLGVPNDIIGQAANMNDKVLARMQYIRQMGEIAHILTDAGLVLISSISNADEYEVNMLKSLNRPNKTIVVNIGENNFNDRIIDLNIDENNDLKSTVNRIINLIMKEIVPDPEFTI